MRQKRWWKSSTTHLTALRRSWQLWILWARRPKVPACSNSSQKSKRTSLLSSKVYLFKVLALRYNLQNYTKFKFEKLSVKHAVYPGLITSPNLHQNVNKLKRWQPGNKSDNKLDRNKLLLYCAATGQIAFVFQCPMFFHCSCYYIVLKIACFFVLSFFYFMSVWCFLIHISFHSDLHFVIHKH